MKKAFRNHKINGVLLNFPNGNSVSSVWGFGTYTDNHDAELYKGNGKPDFDRIYKEPNEGSMTAEIMVDCGEELNRALQEKYRGAGSSVIGYLTIMEWLEVVHRVANENTGKGATL